jgi:hypothetical protein
MKYSILLMLFLISSISLKGQTFAEFFNQRKTQQKYMLQQIAGLQIYISFAKGGYQIVKNGLDGISQIRNGEFNLHNSFFSSLTVLNPALQNEINGLAIPALTLSISMQYRKAKNSLAQQDAFSIEEKRYLQSVLDKIKADMNLLIHHYEDLLEEEQLELSDDERLSRLVALHKELMDNHKILQQLAANISGLAHNRIKELKEHNHFLLINGIND